MTDNELKKLSRKELLEIMIEQAEEIERLQAELKVRDEKIQERELRICNVGSLAEASLALNGVFEAAQAAADQYLENIHNTDEICRKMENDAKTRSAKMMDDAKAQATQIVEEAKEKAMAFEQSAMDNANRYWDNVSKKLEAFYTEHQELKQLLAADHQKQ